jgi:hypothetical protein
METYRKKMLTANRQFLTDRMNEISARDGLPTDQVEEKQRK